jgi:DNA-binding MarR family transcriptional regulator
VARSQRPDAERLAVWRQFLTAHARITTSLADDLAAEQELPLTFYDVLLQLQEAGGKLRMSDLSELSLIAKSSLSRVVDRMEADGLVVRKRTDEDKRSVLACITPEGRRVLRKAAPTHLRGVQQTFAQHLTDTDVAAMQRVFAKMLSD